MSEISSETVHCTMAISKRIKNNFFFNMQKEPILFISTVGPTYQANSLPDGRLLDLELNCYYVWLNYSSYHYYYH